MSHPVAPLPSLASVSWPVNVGQAARLAGLSPKMVRYYESLGLLGDIARSEGGYRLYGQSEVQALCFIRRSRAVGFDMEQTAVVFPAHWLERPVVGADPWVRRIIEQHIVELEKLSPHDLASQIRRVLRVLLLTHSSSARQVAALFSLHPRTLNRRLQVQGTTLQTLIDEGRYAIARHLLENTRMSMGQISAVLDYSDASAFTRAFRRWAGVAPMAWRSGRS